MAKSIFIPNSMLGNMADPMGRTEWPCLEIVTISKSEALGDLIDEVTDFDIIDCVGKPSMANPLTVVELTDDDILIGVHHERLVPARKMLIEKFNTWFR